MTQIISFHGSTYPTKTAATAALREFVATIPLKTWLRPGDDRLEDLFDILDFHPSWGERLGEITKLRFERERGAGIACLVVLDDGNTDKIGWTKTFAESRKPATLLSAALRYEIADQITDFRKLVLDGTIPPISAISGTKLTLRGPDRFHVDHAPAFADTATKWVEAQGGIDAVPVERRRGGGSRMVDDDQANNWWEFHADRHNEDRGLRAITRTENSALGRHHEEV